MFLCLKFERPVELYVYFRLRIQVIRKLLDIITVPFEFKKSNYCELFQDSGDDRLNFH